MEEQMEVAKQADTRAGAWAARRVVEGWAVAGRAAVGMVGAMVCRRGRCHNNNEMRARRRTQTA